MKCMLCRLLLIGGVACAEAVEAIESANDASLNFFTRSLCGKPRIASSSDVERIAFNCIKDGSDPLAAGQCLQALLEATKQKERPALILRLGEFLLSKNADSIDQTDLRLIFGWTRDFCPKRPPGRFPPLCLLTNHGLAKALKSTPGAIGMRVSRLHLYRPKCPRFSTREIYQTGEFEYVPVESKPARTYSEQEYKAFLSDWLAQGREATLLKSP